jgi:hypothetical protein
MWGLLPGWTHMSLTQRKRERGDRPLRPDAGKAEGSRRSSLLRAMKASPVSWKRRERTTVLGCTRRWPRHGLGWLVTAWPRWPAVLPASAPLVELAGGQRGRGRGASRAVRGGHGGAMPSWGQGGSGVEEHWRPWSSAWPAMAVALRHNWKPATHAGAVGMVRPRASVALR